MDSDRFRPIPSGTERNQSDSEWYRSDSERYRSELVGTSRNPTGSARYRSVPVGHRKVLARAHLDLPPLKELLDVSVARLRELQDSTYADTDADDDGAQLAADED